MDDFEQLVLIRETIERLIQARLRKPRGRCYICERNNELVRDHDHVSGAIRGWLCDLCNRAMGQFGEDPERLERAAAYLRASAIGPDYPALVAEEARQRANRVRLLAGAKERHRLNSQRYREKKRQDPEWRAHRVALQQGYNAKKKTRESLV